jgi:hypothetical protein
MNRSHTTERAESGTYHRWEISDQHGSVVLTLLHSRDPRVADLYGQVQPGAAWGSPTESGCWVFAGIGVHVSNRPDSGWSCPEHGDVCDMDAFAGHIADPVWAGLRESGVTDARVYAALQPLFDGEFDEVAS